MRVADILERSTRSCNGFLGAAGSASSQVSIHSTPMGKRVTGRWRMVAEAQKRVTGRKANTGRRCNLDSFQSPAQPRIEGSVEAGPYQVRTDSRGA